LFEGHAVHVSRRHAIRLLAAPALLASLRALSSSAGAESYPAKPIRLIVPYPAGGPYDGIPRLIAQWIGARQGWSIVVDNRTGATGLIGVMAAKQAAPDGHTLVVATTSTHASMPALKRNLAYDAVKDFAPVVLMADATLVLLVREDLPVRSVGQLVGMMRDRPVSSIIRPADMARRTTWRRSACSTARGCRRTLRCTCRLPGSRPR
jgi:tripartite-type tricarboxylate transporter receptor subunit TctC